MGWGRGGGRPLAWNEEPGGGVPGSRLRRGEESTATRGEETGGGKGARSRHGFRDPAQAELSGGEQEGGARWRRSERGSPAAAQMLLERAKGRATSKLWENGAAAATEAKVG